MPKNYPGFIIDRSKRSEQSKHTDDYIVCTDNEIGFIAKVYKVDSIEVHNARIDAMPQEDVDCTFITKTINPHLAVVIEIVKWTSPIYTDRSKLRALLKKSLRAYLYGEVRGIVGDSSEIDKQIGAVKYMTHIAESQYDHIVKVNDEESTKNFITNLRAAVGSLEHIKQLFMRHGRKEN